MDVLIILFLDAPYTCSQNVSYGYHPQKVIPRVSELSIRLQKKVKFDDKFPYLEDPECSLMYATNSNYLLSSGCTTLSCSEWQVGHLQDLLVLRERMDNGSLKSLCSSKPRSPQIQGTSTPSRFTSRIQTGLCMHLGGPTHHRGTHSLLRRTDIPQGRSKRLMFRRMQGGPLTRRACRIIDDIGMRR